MCTTYQYIALVDAYPYKKRKYSFNHMKSLKNIASWSVTVIGLDTVKVPNFETSIYLELIKTYKWLNILCGDKVQSM